MADTPNGLIELEAAQCLKDGLTVDAANSFSIAISLKRIADAIAGNGEQPGLALIIDRIEYNTREVM